MLLKKVKGINYFVSLIILLAIIIILAIAAFLLVTSFPAALASPPPDYEINEYYSFEPWSFELNGITVSYPDGGVIAPFYVNSKQAAVLLVAQGEYFSDSDNVALPADDPAGMFICLDQELFEQIRGDIIFIPVEDAVFRAELAAITELQQGPPLLWAGMIPLVFTLHDSSLFYYFIAETGEPIQALHLIDPPANVYAAIALYTLFMIAVLLMIYIFTLDYQPSRYWQFMMSRGPGLISLCMVAAAVGLTLGGELLPFVTGCPEYTLSAGYFTSAAALILLARLKKVYYLNFGLRPDMLRHGYLIAMAVVTIFIIMMSRDIPKSFVFEGAATIVDFLIILLLIGLAREIIWRGYIQTTLCRQFGATVGLMLTVLLAGLVHFAVVGITAPWMLEYPYTWVELTVLVPGTAAVLGFLYLRTENILSSTILHSLLLFLPRIIVS